MVFNAVQKTTLEHTVIINSVRNRGLEKEWLRLGSRGRISESGLKSAAGEKWVKAVRAQD